MREDRFKKDSKSMGHLLAMATILIWGTTFISTKVLLRNFAPVEILFFRFLLGWAALTAFYPHFLKYTSLRQEFTFLCAGICGVTLYYLLENIALTFTSASNVGVIISTAPFFTIILSRFREGNREKLHAGFIIGFVTAMAGICLVSCGGSAGFVLNPAGDLLALAAALVWAVYSLLTKRISAFGCSTIQTTRRVFFYGLLCMVPTLFFFDFHMELGRLTDPLSLFNLLFLGLGASACCFVSWNQAVKILGAVKTSVYIYLVPVITVITSVLVLKEQISGGAAVGILLTLAGLLLSEKKFERRKHEKNAESRA